MSDQAKGPGAGYLFQFEKALLMLSKLDNATDYVSIEDVDDIATHKENGTVLISAQAKHSISNSGTTFENTSYALWRTLQIWIEKLENGILTDKTDFICVTNKVIPKTSLLFKIANDTFDNVIVEVETLLKTQIEKLKELDANKGSAVKQTIKLIKFVLSKRSEFEKIKKNLKIEDNENIKDKVLNALHLGTETISPLQKQNIYHSFYGWITEGSFDKWRNGSEATFSKEMFDDKYNLIRNSSSIMNAIFRTKKELGTIDESKIDERRKDLFVKQIEEIERRADAKEKIIKKAIQDFIYREIELNYIVLNSDFTSHDFDDFLDDCCEAWQACNIRHVTKDIAKYSDEQLTDFAIAIYDEIMDKIKINFKIDHSFTPENEYIRNGSFLELSNIPRIGWHPKWEEKYKK